MLIFEGEKTKMLEFNMIEVKHIRPEELEYKINIVVEGISYGFPATLDKAMSKINIAIPPLTEFIKSDLDKKYEIKLEVMAQDKKFYDIPWQEKFTVKLKPNVEASLHEDVDAEDDTPSMTMTLSEDMNNVEPTTQAGEVDDSRTDHGDELDNDEAADEQTELDKVKESVEGLPKWFTNK
jgi:hypothetical protein